METTRRSFLKLLALGVIGHELDIDRLLWVPGQKTIFLPASKGVSLSEIVALEMERMIPKLRTLFERDDMFYTAIKTRQVERISGRAMSVPLIIRPGGSNE